MPLTVVASGMVAMAHAHAEPPPTWTFSGFGTVGAVATDSDAIRFRANPRQTTGAGRSPDVGIDSRLGLQGTYRFDDTYSAVGQLLENQRDGNDKPRVEWLFVQASATPWLQLRAGRMVLPVFLESDSRNVGYATHWVRAPSEVYGLFPASSFDGAQAQIATDWNSARLTIQTSAGSSRVHFDSFGIPLFVSFKQIYSLNVVLENGNWTFRLGDTESLRTELSYLPIHVPAFRDAFRGAGVVYDDGRAFVQAEYVDRQTGYNSFLDMAGYYVTAGYHVKSWTPYATFSRFMPAGALVNPIPNTRTVAFGLRWDAIHNVALKAQIEKAQANLFNGVFADPSALADGRSLNLFTLLADVVF